jgi:glycosyltransferase involved in cell wall biosynthesis
LARLARGVDVLHANDIRAAMYTQAAAVIARRPWTFHARDLYIEGSHFERSLRFLRPTRVAAMSDAVRTRAASLFKWPLDRIDVVHSGIDASTYAAQADGPAWRAAVGLRPDDLAVGIVGRLVEWKGQADVIRAAAEVLRAQVDVRFFVIGGELVDDGAGWGEGAEFGRLTRLATDLGVSDRITFTGPTRDPASAMAGLDVALVASWAEPFGLVVLEAMAVGTPLIATAAGGSATRTRDHRSPRRSDSVPGRDRSRGSGVDVGARHRHLMARRPTRVVQAR